MQMKKCIVFLAVFLAALTLAACGNMSEPYLGVEERKAVSDSLFGSLSLRSSVGDSNAYILIAIRNTTQHDLSDVTVDMSGLRAISVPTLPSGVEAHSLLYIGSADVDATPGKEISTTLTYTIERYTYDTDTRQIPFEKMDGPALCLKTDQGELRIPFGETAEVPANAVVQGLSKTKIRSVSYKPTISFNGMYSLSIDLEVDNNGGSSHSVYYKIGDADGNLITTDSAYVHSDSVSLYTYNVSFKEINGQFPDLYLTFSEE